MNEIRPRLRELTRRLDLPYDDVELVPIPRQFWSLAFVALFPTLRLPTPPSTSPSSVSPTQWLRNLRHILDVLALDVLRMDLDHIQAERVFDQDSESVSWLLDIFLGLAPVKSDTVEGTSNAVVDAMAEGPSTVEPSKPEGSPVVPADDDGTRHRLRPGQVANLINDIPPTAAPKQVRFVSPARTARRPEQEAEVDSAPRATIKRPRHQHTTGHHNSATGAVTRQYAQLAQTSRSVNARPVPRRPTKPIESFALTDSEDSDEIDETAVDKAISSVLPGVHVPTWLKNQMETKHRAALMVALRNAYTDRKSALWQSTKLDAEQAAMNEAASRDEAIMRQQLKAATMEAKSQPVAHIDLKTRHAATVRMEAHQRQVEYATRAFKVRRQAQEELLAQAAREQREALLDQRRQEREAVARAADEKRRRLDATRTVLKNKVDMMRERLEETKRELSLQERAAREEIYRARRDEKEALRQRITTIRSQLDQDGRSLYFRQLDIEGNKNS